MSPWEQVKRTPSLIPTWRKAEAGEGVDDEVLAKGMQEHVDEAEDDDQTEADESDDHHGPRRVEPA